jgi:GT2 family glycosyltransferase
MSDVSAKIEGKKRTTPTRARKTAAPKNAVPNGKTPDDVAEDSPPPPPVRDERADMLIFLTSSRLFDRDFYLLSNQDVAASGFDPLEHFFDLGFRESRNPNFYFHVAWYLAANEAALQGHVHPLVHYTLEGEAQGRRPSKFFDPVWYKTRYGLPATDSALRHFLANRTSCLFSPIPEFDALYYGQTYPDVASAGIDPFEHFFLFGYAEGRNPSAEFDLEFYRRRYLFDEPSKHPFLHYLEHRNDPGILLRPLKFDFETQGNTDSSEPPPERVIEAKAEQAAPARHVTPKPAETQPNEATSQPSAKPNWRELAKQFFDERWYLSQLTKIIPPNQTSFEHWWNVGRHEGISPHPIFSSAFYADNLRPTLVEKRDLFLHFLHNGTQHDVDPHPCFSMQWYRLRYSERDIPHPWIDYHTHGKSRGRNPNWLFSHHYLSQTLRNVCDENETPLESYIRNLEGSQSSPHPLLDLPLVMRYNTDVAADSPYISFWTNYRKRDIRTHLYFDPKYYRDQVSDRTVKIRSLADYILFGEKDGLRPGPLFDPTWHHRIYGRSEPYDSLLEEFVSVGERLYRHPCPGFDPRFYLESHNDVARSGAPPLRHFITAGQREKRATHRRFDLSWYAARVDPEVQDQALEHWLEVGRHAAASPHPAVRVAPRGGAADALVAFLEPTPARSTVVSFISAALCAPSPPSGAITPDVVGQPWLVDQFEKDWRSRGVLATQRLKRNEPIVRQFDVFDYNAARTLTAKIKQDFSDLGLEMPFVSVVIPTRNRMKVLKRALNSVLAQTYPNLEVIIVDDGGLDATDKLIAKHFTDKRIVYRSTQAAGVSAARNEGLRSAQGEYIAYVDSDNYWEPQHLELVLKSMLIQGAIAGFSTLRIFNEKHTVRYRGDVFDLPSLQRENYIDMNVYIHHRSIADRGLAFDETLRRCVDWDFILRASQFGAPVYVPVIGCNYVDDSGSLERITTDELSGDFYKVCQRNIDLTPHITGAAPKAEYRASIIWSISADDWSTAQDNLWAAAAHCMNSDDELIIINNAMSHPPTSFLASLSAMTTNVRVIHLWRTFRNYPAANLASTIAKGARLLLWQSGVVFDSTMVDALLEAAAQSPAIVCAPVVVGPEGLLTNVLAAPELTSYVLSPLFTGQIDLPRTGRVGGVVIVQSPVVVRRDRFQDQGGFASTFAVTYGVADFCLRLLADNAAATEVLLEIRLRSAGPLTSASSEGEYLKEYDALREAWLSWTFPPVTLPDGAALSDPTVMKLVNRDWNLMPDPANGMRLVAPHVARPMVFALRCPAPSSPDKVSWGDYHYALAMIAALEKFGHEGVIEFRESWNTGSSQGDVVFHIRGIVDLKPVPNALNAVWVISHPDKIRAEEYAAMDAIFVAGPELKRHLWQTQGVAAHVVLQGTDQTRFCGDIQPVGGVTDKALFVGNSRLQLRPIVLDSIAAGLPIIVHGNDWETLIPAHFIGGNYIRNETLADWYGSSGVVLNDHWPTMREFGIISNRIFDVVATGRPVITDEVSGLGDIFGDAVHSYRDAEELPGLFRELSQRQFKDTAKHVRAHHTIQHRVDEMLAILQISKR